jgi:O-methyltransferase involved in polyketide biosynthesis
MDKLTGVPETMLLTLYHRALDTQRTDSIIKDKFAVRLVEQIDHDFSKFNDWKMQWGIPVRTWLIDTAVHKFLQEHPNSLIVTLGAGLCTRALRLDNGQAQWFSIDLEDVQPFWKKLIGNSERNHFITCSALDFTWMEQIAEMKQHQAVLFIAEGLFQYLQEVDVKQIILTIQQRFPQSEIVMEVLGKFMVNNTKLTRTVAKTGAMFQWGVNDCKELESWADGVMMLNQWYFMDYHRERQGYIMFLPYLLGGKGQFGKVAQFRLSLSKPLTAA